MHSALKLLSTLRLFDLAVLHTVSVLNLVCWQTWANLTAFIIMSRPLGTIWIGFVDDETGHAVNGRCYFVFLVRQTRLAF